jgi:uncharacterized membrane protein
MKIFKATLVVILLIVSTLFLIGVFVPEVDDEFEVKINQPVMQVYAGISNVQQAPLWVAGLDSVAQTGGFLAMPGSSFKLYYSGRETSVVYDMEVLEMVPLKSVKFKLYNDMFEFIVSVDFEANGEGTILKVYSQMKGKGLIPRSFLTILKSSIIEVGKTNFEGLKQFQEH